MSNAQIVLRVQEPGHIPASLEIGEVFALAFTALYQTITKIFTYTTGATPLAEAFTFSLYTSQSDADNRMNPLSDSDVAEFLEYYFSPETPEEGAADEMGYLVMTLIAIPEDYEAIYGVICIEQDPPTYEEKERESITPLEPNKRPHRPTWEIR